MTVRTNRRTFTAGLGASLLAAPFVSLLSRPARAQTTAKAKRLVVFFSPNGTIHRFWRPTGTETEFSFGAGTVLEPLASLRSDLVVVDEMDFFNSDNHAGGMHAMLTANGGAAHESKGMSVDQFIAQSIGGSTKFRSIELGVQTSSWGGNNQTRMSYSGPDAFVTPDDSPANAFKRLFGDLVGGAAEIERLRKRRLSILDAARDELADLHKRLGQQERIKLEAHLSALRDVEKGLTTGGSDSCTVPPKPGTISNYDNDKFPQITKLQIDLAVQAISCGLTKVASVMLSHTVGDRVYSWLNIADGHHSLSHSDDSATAKVADFIKAERWNAEQFAYLVQKLKSLPDPEGGGSLLDTSLVVWAKELGDSRMHSCKSVPWVIAGKGNGVLRTGRYLKLGGKPHSKLLVSLCQAFGLTNQTFGDPAAGSGKLEVL